MKPSNLLILVLLSSAVSVLASDCTDSQFRVHKDSTDYLVINSQTEVLTCGGINICNAIKEALQTLSLSNTGVLAISGTTANPVQLPDASDKNEIQSLSLSQDGTLSISLDSGSVKLPDPSPTNEIQTLSLDSAGKLSISQALGSVLLPDANSTNELQTLTLNGGELDLSNGGGKVQLPDASATNELQNLTLVNNELQITNGNSVNLSYLNKPTLFRAVVNNAYSLPTGYQFTTIPFDTTTIDTANGFVSGGSYKTVVPGWYQATTMLGFRGTASNSYYVETRFYVKNILYSNCIYNSAVSNAIFGTQCSDTFLLNVTDTVAVKVYWSGPDSSLPLVVGGGLCVFNLNKISDPQ